MPDYIPGSGESFNNWLENFHTYLTAHVAHFGLTPADTDPLDDSCSAWTASYAAYTAAQLAAKSARATNKNDRETAVGIVRALVTRLQTNPATTDADREALRIPLRGGAGLAEAGLNPNEDRPMATIDISNHLKHVLKIQNQTSSGVKGGKPAGALGAEVWRKVGVAPQSDTDLTMVGIATRVQYSIEYPMEEGGKQAHYRLRWVNSKGEVSSWSDTESVTIAA
jgi:hypothetical protein